MAYFSGFLQKNPPYREISLKNFLAREIQCLEKKHFSRKYHKIKKPQLRGIHEKKN